jgi:hypothetical protein
MVIHIATMLIHRDFRLIHNIKKFSGISTIKCTLPVRKEFSPEIWCSSANHRMGILRFWRAKTPTNTMIKPFQTLNFWLEMTIDVHP